MTDQPTSGQREKFEAWARTRNCCLTREGNLGWYSDNMTMNLWLAYQAGAPAPEELNEAVEAPPQPETVLSAALHDPQLRQILPIPLKVTREVIVSSEELDDFGHGATLTDAMEDFGKSLRETYHFLNENDGKLGAGLRQVKESLGKYIEKRKSEHSGEAPTRKGDLKAAANEIIDHFNIDLMDDPQEQVASEIVAIIRNHSGESTTGKDV